MILWESFKRHPLTPNGISVLRGVIGLIVPFSILSTSPFWNLVSCALFIVGSISDYWDGYLARKHQGVSDSGKILDPTMDKILILGVLGAFAYRGFFSPWWLVPIFFREIVITFVRIAWYWEGKAAGAEQLGKIKLVVQVVLASACFLALQFSNYEATAGAVPFFRGMMWILLPVCVLLTIVSGMSFFYSNLDNFSSPKFAKFTSACGVGLLPAIPGTYGSLLALFIIPFVVWNFWLWVFVFLFLFAAGYWAVSRLDGKEKDPGFVVIDEVLGMFITLAGVPFEFLPYLTGFLLFRLFDILKPPPCRQLEKYPGYWGIILDDLMAGVYARLVLFLFLRV